MSHQTFLAELLLEDGRTEHFRASSSAESSDDYEIVVAVDGHSQTAPTHAVFARWLVKDEASLTSFEGSRRTLFGLRRDNIGSFVCDVLLRKRGAEPAQYVVIGLYGDEEGRSSARSHPAVAAWAEAHPPPDFSAVDTTGMQLATVVELHRS